ncbi:EAL domain-containing protein [Idiomarina piscisalsi]|uniref:bifunctional diguanylate cyclase/phosphodiesterase n=1 Tax=Idiomarina piscisalsi TaxID=1096243 RepID=UPI00137F2DD1|nr:EAL domain-containing protein [Idiomarina piscisalsi]MTJ02011.1 EAL domain-containing protein [Idiomarina piscisalsi]
MIRRFRTRLIVILLLLVSGSIAISLFAMNFSVEQQAERSIAQELNVSERVFRELLNSRSELLLQAAQVLTDDFGFKRAVATGDKDTIVSVLVNHGERINTELMVLQTPAGGEIAATHPIGNEVTKDSHGQHLAIVDGELFQLITVPVKAPQLIAWATLGFQIDSNLAAELQNLANADISLWQESSKKVIASSLEPELQTNLQNALKRKSSLTNWLDEQALVGKETLLEASQGDQVHVLLSSSLEEAMADVHRVQWQMLLIGVLAVLIAGAVALLMARSVSRPLSRLTEAAKQLQKGDYGNLNLEKRADEFGELAITFESMKGAVSERERRISFQATHDQLTGLPNRAQFAADLERLLNRGCEGTLLLINIRKFRTLNDTLGQEVGDFVLKQIAQRLTDFGEQSLSARIGGDEFALVFEDKLSANHDLIKSLRSFIEKPVKVGESDYPILFNTGAVEFPRQGKVFDTLLRRAQVSAQEAKRRQDFVFLYSEGLDEQYLRKLDILEHLKYAADEKELTLLLQPKIETQTGKTIGAEALLRWQNEKLGFVGPDEFIPLAEQSGLIKKLTEWVFKQSVSYLKRINVAGDFSLSINLSAIDLLSDEILSVIDELEREMPELNKHLILEVTESAIVSDPDAAIERLNWLRGKGYQVSIDDYGTGYSSLEQMRRLPVTELKIDRAFVQPLVSSVTDQSIVRSTIQLAHELGLKVVAEGVEDVESWNWLKNQNCDVLQGFYFSKPIPLDDFNERLKGESRD